jgi:hypothetical protein
MLLMCSVHGSLHLKKFRFSSSQARIDDMKIGGDIGDELFDSLRW